MRSAWFSVIRVVLQLGEFSLNIHWKVFFYILCITLNWTGFNFSLQFSKFVFWSPHSLFVRACYLSELKITIWLAVGEVFSSWNKFVSTLFMQNRNYHFFSPTFFTFPQVFPSSDHEIIISHNFSITVEFTRSIKQFRKHSIVINYVLRGQWWITNRTSQ